MVSFHSLERGYAGWDQKLIHSLTQLWNLWIIMTIDVARLAHGDNSGTDAMGLTKHFLLQKRKCITGYCKYGQEPIFEEFIDAMSKLTIINFSKWV